MSKKKNINSMKINNNNIHGNLTQKQNKQNQIDKSKEINIQKYYLTNEEKKEKKKLEKANRYGFRKVMDEGNGGTLLRCSALVSTKMRIVNDINMYLAINIHDSKGRFMSDHIYIEANPIDEVIRNTTNNQDLIYVDLIGRPYNYNENRYDGYSIDVSKEAGGSVIVKTNQSIFVTDVKKYKLFNDTHNINYWLKSLPGEEYIHIINQLNNKINDIVGDDIRINFIYDYILWSYLLTCSHQELYLNNIKLQDLDYNNLFDIIILLSSTIYELQKNPIIKINELFQTIAYELTSIQHIKNFNNYKSNNKFKDFEANINKSNSWNLISYRKTNFNLNYLMIPDIGMVFNKGLNVLSEIQHELL